MHTVTVPYEFQIAYKNKARLRPLKEWARNCCPSFKGIKIIWEDDQCGSTSEGIEFYFENKRDALLFALRWT